MTQANRIDPRAKALKDYFATINESPSLAKDSPLLQKPTLERLARQLHLTPDQLATSPDEQVRQVGKALMLNLFVPEYRKEIRNLPLLQGLLLFWHEYPSPISAVHPAPSIMSVVAYCSDAGNLAEFLKDARRWASAAYADDPQRLREVLALLVPETLRKIVLAGLPNRPTESERRTYGNYLNTAAREVARELESLVPEFFTESELIPGRKLVTKEPEIAVVTLPVGVERQVQVYPPRQLELVADQMAQTCSRLAWLGDVSVPVNAFCERPVLFRELRGAPRAPALVKGTDAHVNRMTGFLAGVLGSGRTAFLKALAYQFAQSFLENPARPLALYFCAKDFVIYARNRRSIHAFISESLPALGDGFEEFEFLVECLRKMDQAGKLLILVDDLDRLPTAEQEEVVAQLTFSPAVIFAVLPWQVEPLAKIGIRAHLGEFSLSPLDPDSQMEFLECVERAMDQVWDRQLVRCLCSELPDLAKEPLGLVTILEQAQRSWTDMTRTVEVALEEYVRRAGLPPPPFLSGHVKFSQEWEHLKGCAFELNLALRAQDGYESLNGQPELVVTRHMVGYHWQMSWEQVLHTGLFRPVESIRGDGLALVNLDLALYLVARQALDSRWTFDLPQRPIHPTAAELLQRAGRHWENLRRPNRDLPPPTYFPSPNVHEAKSWFERIPEIFRILS